MVGGVLEGDAEGEVAVLLGEVLPHRDVEVARLAGLLVALCHELEGFSDAVLDHLLLRLPQTPELARQDHEHLPQPRVLPEAPRCLLQDALLGQLGVRDQVVNYRSAWPAKYSMRGKPSLSPSGSSPAAELSSDASWKRVGGMSQRWGLRGAEDSGWRQWSMSS